MNHNESESPTNTPFSQLQRRVDNWISKLEIGYFSPLSNFARLVEEVGELARHINARAGEKPPKSGEDHSQAKLEEEFGDILFTLACLANQLGINLDHSIETMFHKINMRDVGSRYKEKDVDPKDMDRE